MRNAGKIICVSKCCVTNRKENKNHVAARCLLLTVRWSSITSQSLIALLYGNASTLSLPSISMFSSLAVGQKLLILKIFLNSITNRFRIVSRSEECFGRKPAYLFISQIVLFFTLKSFLHYGCQFVVYRVEHLLYSLESSWFCMHSLLSLLYLVWQCC